MESVLVIDYETRRGRHCELLPLCSTYPGQSSSAAQAVVANPARRQSCGRSEPENPHAYSLLHTKHRQP